MQILLSSHAFVVPFQARVFKLAVCGFVLSIYSVFLSVISVPLANAKETGISFGRDIASSTWHTVEHKQALVCFLNQLPHCLNLLPSHLKSTPSLQPRAIKTALGLKTAMVLSVTDSDVAGVVVVNSTGEAAVQFAGIEGRAYQLDLQQQTLLSTYHELGHLHNLALLGDVLPEHLTPFEHEWLADVFLYWHIANHQGSLALMWQQFHRRNLAVIDNVANMSHWSAPYLLPLLNQPMLSKAQLADDYRSFLVQVLPTMPTWQADDIQEFSNLIKQAFSHNRLHLPHYLYWRQAQLVDVMQPTLIKLMGEASAISWLDQQFPQQNRTRL